MKQNVYAMPEPGEALAYDREALRSICKKKDIRQVNLMSIFKQSNPSTSKKWLNGEDMYVNNLLKIINHYDLNILDFFMWRGHKFTTTLEQIAMMEELGIDISAILAGEIKESDINVTNNVFGNGPQNNTINNSNEQMLEDFRFICEQQKELLASQRVIIEELRSRLESKESQPQSIRFVADTTEV